MRASPVAAAVAVLVAVAALAAPGSRAGDETPISDTEVVLGQSAVFKGPSAALGTELWRGAAACFEEINTPSAERTSAGINGRKIRVLALDDGYDPERTLPNTLDFLTKKHVFGLFGYVGTPTLVRALPAVQKFSSQGAFLFSCFTGAQPQREAPHDRWVFNVRASYRQETAGLVESFTTKLGKRRIGVFIQDDAYGRSGADGTARALRAKGLDVVSETTYTRGTKFDEKMTAQVEILKTAGVDAVIAVGAYGPCAAFVRDARAGGLDVPIGLLSFVGTDALLGLLTAEEHRGGVSLTKRVVVSEVVPSWEDTSVPLVRDYRAAVDRFDPRLPPELEDATYRPAKYSYGALEGYLNARVFAAALAKAPRALTRSAFVAAAESLTALDVGLVGSTVTFSHERHQALDRVYFAKLENGHAVPLEDWSELR